MKGIRLSHFINCNVKCLNYRGTKRLCHITDSKSYDLLIRMFRLVGGNLFCNSRE